MLALLGNRIKSANIVGPMSAPLGTRHLDIILTPWAPKSTQQTVWSICFSATAFLSDLLAVLRPQMTPQNKNKYDFAGEWCNFQKVQQNQKI